MAVNTQVNPMSFDEDNFAAPTAEDALSQEQEVVTVDSSSESSDDGGAFGGAPRGSGGFNRLAAELVQESKAQ